jgi:hypothetical protein
MSTTAQGTVVPSCGRAVNFHPRGTGDQNAFPIRQDAPKPLYDESSMNCLENHISLS